MPSWRSLCSGTPFGVPEFSGHDQVVVFAWFGVLFINIDQAQFRRVTHKCHGAFDA